MCYVLVGLVVGLPLQGFSEDIQIYLSQFESMGTHSEMSKRIRMIWQVVMNLMGTSENQTVISGSAISEEFVDKTDLQIWNDFIVLKSFLCVHFGQHEQGSRLALERGDSSYKQRPGTPFSMIDPFLRGVSLYAMARKTRKSKYKKEAQKCRARLEEWVKKGNPNVYHQFELLNAEHAALSKREDTSELYFKATRVAIRGGWVHDAALMSERHAEYLLETNDKAGAVEKLKEAIERYGSWGAAAKVQQLEEMYADLL